MACPHQRSSLANGEIVDIEDLCAHVKQSDRTAQHLHATLSRGVEGEAADFGWSLSSQAPGCTTEPATNSPPKTHDALGPFVSCPSHAYIFHVPSGAMSRAPGAHVGQLYNGLSLVS